MVEMVWPYSGGSMVGVVKNSGCLFFGSLKSSSVSSNGWKTYGAKPSSVMIPGIKMGEEVVKCVPSFPVNCLGNSVSLSHKIQAGCTGPGLSSTSAPEIVPAQYLDQWHCKHLLPW